MSAAPQSSLSIATPEGVVFSYELATPVLRALAWIIDAVAIGGMTYFLSRVVNIAGFLSADFASFLSVVLYFLISVGYGIALEWRWRGQTLGKRVFGLRVIDVQGMRLQFPQIALRNLMRPIDSLPMFYLVGGMAALSTQWGQRLGDLVANTVVARERFFETPDLNSIAPAKYNSLLAYPRLAGRLRTMANPEAVGFALQAVTERTSYNPSARVELFADLANYFRSLAHFPEAAIEGLSDEQFVAAVVRVIYRNPGRPTIESGASTVRLNHPPPARLPNSSA